MAAADLLAWWWLSSPGAASAWWYWFLFLNVLVGAIAVTSSRAQQRASGRRLCRSASSMVLDRLRRSFSIHSAAAAGEWCSTWYYGPPEADDKITQVVREEWWAPEPEPAAAEAEAEPAPVGTAADAPANALADTAAAEDKAVADDDRHEFCRQSDAQGSPSSAPQPAAVVAAVATAGAEATGGAVPPRPPAQRQEEAGPAAAVAEFAKPNRRGRARGHAYAEVEGKAELNARAERFIQQFRQDLKLQRLNSILSAAITQSAPISP